MLNTIVKKNNTDKIIGCEFCHSPILNLTSEGFKFINEKTIFTQYSENNKIGKAVLIETICANCHKENIFEKTIYKKVENIENGVFEMFYIYNEDYLKEEKFIYKKEKIKNNFLIVNNEEIILLENAIKNRMPKILESLIQYENFDEKNDLGLLVDLVKNKKPNYFIFLNFYIESYLNANKIVKEMISLTSALSKSNLSEENKIKLLSGIKVEEKKYIIKLGDGIDLISNITNNCNEKEKILEHFLLEYGENSNEKEITNLRYCYFPINVNRESFIKMLNENEIFNTTLLYEVKSITKEDIVIYRYYKENRIYKEIIKNRFINFIAEHLNNIEGSLWSKYEDKASLCDLAIAGQEFLKEYKNDIKNMSRLDFVKEHIYETNCLKFEFQNDEKTILLGELNGEAVYYNPRGIYFYYNEEIDTVFEILLTMPSKCL